MASSTKAPGLALVAGGVRGIGLATARTLKRDGWQVVLADRDHADPEIAETFPCLTMDIANTDSVDTAVKEISRTFGAIDGLVNAAGFNRHQSVSDLEDETWRSLFDVHLGGTLRLCRACHRSLKKRPGAVVNFSSVNARIGRPRRAPYAAAKGGVEALTRTLAIEWAAEGIRVNAVVPGAINTRMVQDNVAQGRVDLESMERFIPLHRLGEAEEVADAVAFLLSDRASYITGQTLVVDGGVLANGDW
ncbi:MAG: SDR family oxidoreductase [Pirellulales bacterium]|nr:SDR family oxidoreductase [Pirellulales bacterium]